MAGYNDCLQRLVQTQTTQGTLPVQVLSMAGVRALPDHLSELDMAEEINLNPLSCGVGTTTLQPQMSTYPQKSGSPSFK